MKKVHWHSLLGHLMVMAVFPVTIACPLLFLGCGQLSAPDYFPLTANLKNEGTVQVTLDNGTIQKGRYVYRTDGQETIKGKSYWRCVLVHSGVDLGTSVSLLRKGPEGVFACVTDSDRPEQLWLPFPTPVAEEWTVDYGELKILCKREADETAQLFERKYENCLRVKREVRKANPSGTTFLICNEQSWLAPNAGPVRLSTQFADDLFADGRKLLKKSVVYEIEKHSH